MTWKNRSKETQSVYRCLAVVFGIYGLVGLYNIWHTPAKAKPPMTEIAIARDKEMARELAAMGKVRQEAGGRARAIKEVGDGNVRVHN